MPKYNYKCKKCGKAFQLRHAISEPIDKHPDCEEECVLQKLPSSFRFVKVSRKVTKNKPGVVVKEHIESAKEEIEKQKEEYKSEDFEKK